MIEITVNGEPVSIAEPMTVEQVLDTVEVPPNYLAVEVNAEVVPTGSLWLANDSVGR